MDKQWRSTGWMQAYLLKNSPRSTLLLLLRGGRSEKSKELVFDWLCVWYNGRGLYLYPRLITPDPYKQISKKKTLGYMDSSFLHVESLLMNSPRSTLLLLLRGGRSRKSKLTCIWLIVCSFTIAGAWYLYPGPTHDSCLSMTHHNFWHNENIPNLR